MKILAKISLILALACVCTPAEAKKPSEKDKKHDSEAVEQQARDNEQPALVALTAERDSLQAELNALQAMVAPLDEYMDAGLGPLYSCNEEIVLVTDMDMDRYGAALAAYEQVRPMMSLYNPYPDLDFDAMAVALRGRIAMGEKIARAKALLTDKNTPKLEEASLTELEAIMKDETLTEQDRQAVRDLSGAIQKDRNWGDIYRDAIQRLREWAVLPDAKMASSAYDKIIKPVIVDKIAQVYPGRETLPDEFVKLNSILAQLTDATKNYSKSKYRSKVSSEPAFKAWLRQLADSL